MYEFINQEAFKDLNLDAFDPDPNEDVSYWQQLLKNAQRKMSLYRTWRYKSMLSEEQVDEIFQEFPDEKIEIFQ